MGMSWKKLEAMTIWERGRERESDELHFRILALAVFPPRVFNTAPITWLASFKVGHTRIFQVLIPICGPLRCIDFSLTGHIYSQHPYHTPTNYIGSHISLSTGFRVKTKKNCTLHGRCNIRHLQSNKNSKHFESWKEFVALSMGAAQPSGSWRNILLWQTSSNEY